MRIFGSNTEEDEGQNQQFERPRRTEKQIEI